MLNSAQHEKAYINKISKISKIKKKGIKPAIVAYQQDKLQIDPV